MLTLPASVSFRIYDTTSRERRLCRILDGRGEISSKRIGLEESLKMMDHRKQVSLYDFPHDIWVHIITSANQTFYFTAHLHSHAPTRSQQRSAWPSCAPATAASTNTISAAGSVRKRCFG